MISLKENIENNTHISELADGMYIGKWYAHTLELKDGRKFYTETGVRRSRSLTPDELYCIKNGEIIIIK